MLLSVVHSTRYRYAAQVSRSTQYIRLTPYPSPQQRIVSWAVELPVPAVTMSDAFDNVTHVLTLDRPHQEIHLVARGSVEVPEVDDGEPAGRINPKVFLRATRLTAADDAIRDFVQPMRAMVRSRPLIGVTDLMNAVLDRVPFARGLTAADTTAAQAFAAGGGVSQDQAHVFLACCRALGVPARYVSGYAYSPNREQVASLAWAEAWLATRWVSFDVANARSAGGGHIKLAIGLDYLDACPVRGVRLGGGEEELSTAAQVRPARF
jgi:transglutaminase-like putative cysteine protease